MTRFCTECGSPRQHAEERFCGGCGTPLPSESSASSASVPFTAPTAPARPAASPPSWGGAPVGADYLTSTPLPPRGSGRRGLRAVVIGLAVLLAAGGGGAVAWQVLAPQGGAANPEAAVQEFVAAVAAQDVVAALDLVAPAEVQDMDEVYTEGAERLEEAGLVPQGRITDAVDLQLSGLTYEVDQLNDELAVVSLTGGRYDITIDPTRLSPGLNAFSPDIEPGSYSGDLIEELGHDVPDRDWTDDRAEPYLVTTAVDGRWYVSAMGTYATWLFSGSLGAQGEMREEYLSQGIRLPDPDAVQDDTQPIVGSDVDEVIANLVSAINRDDVGELVDNLPQDEVRALRPFIVTVQDALRQEFSGFDVGVEDLDYETSEEGDLLRVTFKEAYVRGAVSDDGYYDSGWARLAGPCGYAAEDDDYEEGGCLPDAFTDTIGIKEPFVMLREVAGGYQLSPLATVTAYARQVVRSVPARVLQDLVDAVADSSDEQACLALGLGDLC